MKSEDYWRLFVETGSPEIYLLYKHAERESGQVSA